MHCKHRRRSAAHITPIYTTGYQGFIGCTGMCYTRAIMRTIILTLVCICTTLVACSGDGGDTDGDTATLQPGVFSTGDWAARVTLPGGDIRFVLRLGRAEDGSGYTASVHNGDEKVPIGGVSTEGSKLLLFFPAFNSCIEADLVAGALEGSLTLAKRDDVEQELLFRAEYAQGMRFSIPAEPDVDVTGRWEVAFVDEEGTESSAIGEFRQEQNKLFGTFLTPTGDYRYLAGDVRGRDINLSCFDGSHAFLFTATVAEDGMLAGDFWSGTKWHEWWTAERNADIALPDPYKLTYLNDGYDSFEFSFPDVEGKTVSMDDEFFRDKAVIVVLAGSWCPNCHDEAAFLSRFYTENRSRGLEIVGLMYEHSRDRDKAVKQITRFAHKHNIEFPLLYAGYSDKNAARNTLPMLNHIMSYPTTIFIDKSGAVRGIHTGFNGPGTGQHYEKFKSEFNDMVNSILTP